ncbi:MAG: PIN domain-containing protein [Deltaproteobacteria bacterium]|nr:PIN domain-containing protein [Deltaproteobacteria bacterium]
MDAGPLVAFLDRSERHHAWVTQAWDVLGPRVITCEAALAEAAYLVGRIPGGAERLDELLATGGFRIEFDLAGTLGEVLSLRRRFRSVPMSLADACLVRMAELHGSSSVMTLDRDFLVYRKNGRGRIPLIAPFV